MSEIRIETRDALIYLLFEAAELEHAICCQYLFAAFSMKDSVEEGLTPREIYQVLGWRKVLLEIAAEEMLHLATVNNLLAAIGGAPRVGRPNLPLQGRHYPPGIQFAFLPFGEAAMRHFVFLERPEGINLKDAEGFLSAFDPEPPLGEDEIVPRPQNFATVGELYRSIERGFERLVERHGEEWVFIGDLDAQATPETFQWEELVAVHDLASAKAAVDVVVEQGEGPRGHWRDAHYGRLLVVLGDLLTMKKANPKFEPARPVMAANCRHPVDSQLLPLVTNPTTVRVMDAFNVAYEVMLYTLARYFAHGHETPEQLQALADVAVLTMIQVIKPLGMAVTRLPVGEEFPGMNAGPSFELFHGSGYLMPHTWQAWVLLHERLVELGAFLERVLEDPSSPDGLEEIGPAIDRIAGILVTHMPRLDERDIRPPLSWNP